MSHRYLKKQINKANSPQLLYRTYYDRIFIWCGYRIMNLGRRIAVRGRMNKTRRDRFQLSVGSKIAQAGYSIKEWRYPPRSRRKHPC